MFVSPTSPLFPSDPVLLSTPIRRRSWVGVSAVTRGIVLTRTKPRFTVHVVAKLPLIPLNRNPSCIQRRSSPFLWCTVNVYPLHYPFLLERRPPPCCFELGRAIKNAKTIFRVKVSHAGLLWAQWSCFDSLMNKKDVQNGLHADSHQTVLV